MRFVLRLAVPLIAGVIALAPVPASLIERAYANGVYAQVQPPLTRITNVVPFALLDLWIALAAAWAVWRFARQWRAPASRWRRSSALIWDLAVASACVYLAFVLLWGFNYQRRPAAERFGVQKERVTRERLAALGERAVSQMNALYAASGDARSRTLTGSAADLDAPFSRALRRLGQEWQPAVGHPKASLVARMFPLAAVDGMMNPLALEVILNPEVLSFERPFLLAHEWAHLAGYARESEASFVAWLTCLEGDAAAQYSGWVAVSLHAARSLPGGSAWLSSRLSDGPRRDLEAIRDRLARASPLMQKTTWRVYDRYLRANRVESGIANYDEVTILILGSPIADAALHPR